MIGIIVNVLAVAVGGLLGAFFKRWLSPHLTENMNLIFGVCAICMGIQSVILMENMPAVIMAVVIGTIIGLLGRLGDKITKCGELLEKPLSALCGSGGNCGGMPREEYLSLLVTTLVLFCSSGSGIYGCLDAGISGDSTILLSKSILDLFTAMVFACSLGAVVAVVAVPKFMIYVSLFMLGTVIVPLTTPAMIADFKACGGFLLVATGFRIAKMQNFPIADMLPAMVLVMPMSTLWTNYVLPLL